MPRKGRPDGDLVLAIEWEQCPHDRARRARRGVADPRFEKNMTLFQWVMLRATQPAERHTPLKLMGAADLDDGPAQRLAPAPKPSKQIDADIPGRWLVRFAINGELWLQMKLGTDGTLSDTTIEIAPFRQTRSGIIGDGGWIRISPFGEISFAVPRTAETYNEEYLPPYIELALTWPLSNALEHVLGRDYSPGLCFGMARPVAKAIEGCLEFKTRTEARREVLYLIRNKPRERYADWKKQRQSKKLRWNPKLFMDEIYYDRWRIGLRQSDLKAIDPQAYHALFYWCRRMKVKADTVLRSSKADIDGGLAERDGQAPSSKEMRLASATRSDLGVKLKRIYKAVRRRESEERTRRRNSLKRA